jgi:hypothetical protein
LPDRLAAGAGVSGLPAVAGAGRPSFLKKVSKKLLLIASSMCFKEAKRVPSLTDENFLVLFFKKELLSFVSH